MSNAIRLLDVMGVSKLDKLIMETKYLYNRWQDEKKYEDFNDYIKAFEKATKFKVVLAKKRPFNFTFQTGKNQYHWIQIANGKIQYGSMLQGWEPK